MSKERSSLEEVHLHLLTNGESNGHNRDSDLESYPAYPTTRKTYGRKRLTNKLVCGGVIVGLIIGLVVFASRSPHVRNIEWPKWPSKLNDQDDDMPQSEELTSSPDSETLISPYRDKSRYFASGHGRHFRENLLNNTKYVTASPMGGYSNQVMAQINLLYLARLTNRVAVIYDFVPGHMHGNPGPLPVSLVYDLPRLAEALQVPVIEWTDIKGPEADMDEIGCWSLHLTLWGENYNSGGHFPSEHQFQLDISLWPVPDSRFIPQTNHLNLMAVASLAWPEVRTEALKHSNVSPSRHSKHTLEPDERMLCYDSLYYAATVKSYEWFERWNPMWTQVGTHMHWEPRIEALARGYIYGAFRLPEEGPFPLYISVHIRHTDFAQMCEDEKPDCFPPLTVYDEKVREVRAELLEKNGLHVDKVLVTSDEEDPAWWKTVRDYGWHHIDWVADQTEEKYSEWYPIVLDSIALSLAKGFVGTTRSTLSMLAARRVEDWEHGFTREVHLRNE